MLLMKKIAVSRATPTQTTRASSSARPRSSAGGALALVQLRPNQVRVCHETPCSFLPAIHALEQRVPRIRLIFRHIGLRAP